MEPKQPPPMGGDNSELQVFELGKEIRVPSGARIVSQGEAPQAFYVIKSGLVKVFRETADGIRTDLTDLGPGSYFGEVALVTGQPRTASVEAVAETFLIEIAKDDFDQVLDQNPQLARHIIKQLASWLVTGDRRLESEVVHQVKLRQISWFDYLLMVGLSIVFALVFNLYNDNQIPLFYHPGGKDAVGEISLSQALDLYRKNEAVFVDARKDSFFKQRHIKDSLSLPVIFFDLMYPMFEFMAAQKGGAKDKPVIAYGGGPSRRFDLELAGLLNKKGYEKAMVLSGDYQAWQNAFPLEGQEGKKPAALPLGFAGAIEWVPLSIFVLLLIPPIRRSPYLSVFCRVLLGWIFIQFALSKIMRPAVFALNVVDYGMMPAWGVNLWSLALPWAELVAGLFLILGIRTRAAATLIGAMNILFIVGLVNAIHHDLPINCGCVGEAGEPVNWWKVTKNAGMLLMAIQVFLYDRIFVLDRGGFIWRERKI
ncbi:MAG: cyclic nucleotide-binding domain-containing protein [Deltaproteobacteria bacterium]|nr:cyclic nucleotide-binding domain-containing protein [Deltaproteobacteria bacterium]